MKICILGTAAAEGWPALFCDCEACKQARQLGGKNIRTRCSLTIDDKLKVDFPPDTLVHCHRSGQGLENLEYILFSHSHADHLATSELEYIIPPFAKQDKSSSLKIFGNSACIDKIRQKILHHRIEEERPELLNTITPFKSFVVGSYEIHSLRAEHASPEEESLNYIIGNGGKYLLYTCDTGFYSDETWDFLGNFSVDLVISECTGGLERLDYGKHMGFPNVLDFRRRAEAIGLSDKNTRWILTHFSHTGNTLHNELEEAVGPRGFEVAWDGMHIEL